MPGAAPFRMLEPILLSEEEEQNLVRIRKGFTEKRRKGEKEKKGQRREGW